MSHRKKLIVERRDDIIYVKNKEGTTLRKFEHDENIKVLRNFNTQKRANEQVILEYFKRKAEGHIYKPTTKEEFNSRFDVFVADNKFKSYNKHYKTFNKGSYLTFANQKRLKDFDYMYIQVTLKIHFDGFYTEARGRSDYYYKSEYKNGVPNNDITKAIHQATMRALAPYGSNLDFRFIGWQFVYHRPPEDERYT